MNYAHPLPGETFSFSIHLAEEVSLDAALVFACVCQCLRNEGFVKDKRKWVHVNDKRWQQHLAFLPATRRKSACKQLVNSGLINQATFMSGDTRKNFFSISPEKLADLARSASEKYYEGLMGAVSVVISDSPSEVPVAPRALTLAKKFQTSILDRFPRHESAKSADLRAWANRLEAYQAASTVSWERIQDVIDYALDDPFWAGKVLSPLQLVRHFMVLESQLLERLKKEIPLEMDAQGNTLNDKASQKYPDQEVGRDHRLAEYHKTQNTRY